MSMITRDWEEYFGYEVEDQYEPDEKQDYSEAGISDDATSGTDIRLGFSSPRLGELFLSAKK